MFKNEINFIYDFNLNKLQLLGDRVTIKDIKTSKIHPALIHYIDATIDAEIFYDRKKIETNSIFNYTSDRINNYFGLISDEIKRIQIFKSRDIKDIIQKGIIFNVNYLTQPNKTLTKFIFDGVDVKSVEEIILAITHAYYYRYLKKILLMYLEKKKVLLMKKDEFNSLLFRIDQISKETHIEETLSTAVNSMVNFFDPQNKSSEKLPLGAVSRYLEEKRLIEYQQKIEQKFGTDVNTLCAASDILLELKSVTPEKEVEIEIEKQEEELIIDNSEDDSIYEEDTPNESFDEQDKMGDQLESQGEEIYDIEENEQEIPNHQILSEDDYANEKFRDERIPVDDGDFEEKSNEVEESQEDSDEIQNDAQDLKKKPNSIHLLTKLIDVNSLYESLLPEIKPFEDFGGKEISTLKNNDIFNDLNFLHDQSTIKEEISISRKEKDLFEEIETVLEHETSPDDIPAKIDEEAKLTNLEDDFDKEDQDLNLTIDKVISDQKIEEEYLTENNSLEIAEEEIVKSEDLENVEDITLLEEDEEELTEVFTDLAFLDKSEESTEVVEEIENVEDTESKEESTEIDKDSSDSKSYSIYSNFAELLSQNDMTKIIEHIFDYDMEDYHFAIDRISNSENEENAVNFIDGYCQENHIDRSSSEVEHFKSLISEYFTQAYT